MPSMNWTPFLAITHTTNPTSDFLPSLPVAKTDSISGGFRMCDLQLLPHYPTQSNDSVATPVCLHKSFIDYESLIVEDTRCEVNLLSSFVLYHCGQELPQNPCWNTTVDVLGALWWPDVICFVSVIPLNWKWQLKWQAKENKLN